MVEPPRIMTSSASSSAEEDCACPDGGFSLTSLPNPGTAAIWQVTTGLYRAPLPDDHELVFNPLGPLNVLVLNHPARMILDTFLTPQPLDQLPPPGIPRDSAAHTIDQLLNLRLLQPMGWRPEPISSQPYTLTAWLHVTNACNLRCTYCYLAKTDDPMDEGTGIAAVDAVFRSAVRNGFRKVKLKYAGGESTLNFPLVKKLHQHAVDLSARTGLELREVVLSNGIALTRALISYLHNEGIRLMVSLDGIGATHDAQRVFVNGRGSFLQVARGIDRAVQQGLLPDLSVTVTGNNAHDLSKVVHFALDRELRFNLNFYRENDCSTTHTGLLAAETRIIDGMRAAFAVIESRLPSWRLIDGLVDRSTFTQPHEYACGAGHNYLVIDQHGQVARCQMEIEQPITDVLADDPLEIIRLEQHGFQNVRVSEKEGCRACTWRYWCAGGCSLLTFRATGRTDIKSPYCNVYKALYPEVLRLEGLRLLKWSAPAA